MRWTVIGAGVIGQAYAGRLAAAGESVRLVARGSTLAELREHGVRLVQDGAVSRPPVTVGDADEAAAAPADVVVLAVRADQLDAALPLADRLAAAAPEATIMTLVNLVDRADELAARWPGRLVPAFSGLGGGRTPAGVEIHEVGAQATAVGRAHGRHEPIVAALDAAGFTTAVEPDMDSWLRCHAVFVAGISAAILDAGGAEALAADRTRVAAMVRGVRDGLRALARRGHRIVPGPIRTVFTRLPVPLATMIWRRLIAGPTGTVSIEPHLRATERTETALLLERAQGLVGAEAPRFAALVARATG